MSEKEVSVQSSIHPKTRQFSTFYVSGSLYGLDVVDVQEVTKSMPMTKVPLSPSFVCGLINLRGQVATAIGLRDLFRLDQTSVVSDQMNVVCKGDGLLLSLLVDQIGDVLEVDQTLFEPTPDTLSESVSKFMVGIYKIPGELLSILDINKIVEALQK
jgi:purine-binding chemotaxis protein CheW